MKKRTITSVLALIIFIPFIIWGGFPFILVVLLLATRCLAELLRMFNMSNYRVPFFLAMILLWLVLLPPQAVLLDMVWFEKSEAIIFMLLLLLSYTVLVKNKFTFDQAGVIFFSTIYVGMGFFYLIEARLGENGLANIIFAFLIIWSTDTGAYLAGRLFGKHKLWPSISPKKTVEGAIGGVVLACILAGVFHMIHPFSHPTAIVVIVTIAASIFGQVGDLVESALKRHYHVKDSGRILPGHGGILDRFDSLLFILPLLHFIQFM